MGHETSQESPKEDQLNDWLSQSYQITPLKVLNKVVEYNQKTPSSKLFLRLFIKKSSALQVHNQVTYQPLSEREGHTDGISSLLLNTNLRVIQKTSACVLLPRLEYRNYLSGKVFIFEKLRAIVLHKCSNFILCSSIQKEHERKCIFSIRSHTIKTGIILTNLQFFKK